MTPTATPALASTMTEVLTDHRASSIVPFGARRRVEQRAVRLQREDEAGGVGAEQDEGDDERHRLEVRAEVHALLADLRQAAAGHELEDRRHDERDRGEQQHRGLHRGRRRVERLPRALQAADEHRGAHDEQDVAEDRADDRRLDDLLQAGVQGEDRDDHLRRVAEGHVQQAADARAGAVRELLGRASHERRRRDDAGGGRAEDDRGLRVVELEQDRDRDERDEQVRPARARQQEAARLRDAAPLALGRRVLGRLVSHERQRSGGEGRGRARCPSAGRRRRGRASAASGPDAARPRAGGRRP